MGGRACVLVAEREVGQRGPVAAALRAAGNQVLEARDGAQLLGLIEFVVEVLEQRLDDVVVIADAHLPGLSGLDVLAVLRCAGRSTPVVLSAWPDDQAVRREAEELGAAAVIDRTLDPGDVCRVVHALTGSGALGAEPPGAAGTVGSELR